MMSDERYWAGRMMRVGAMVLRETLPSSSRVEPTSQAIFQESSERRGRGNAYVL